MGGGGLGSRRRCLVSARACVKVCGCALGGKGLSPCLLCSVVTTVRAIAKYPAGYPGRWESIAKMVNQGEVRGIHLGQRRGGVFEG